MAVIVTLAPGARGGQGWLRHGVSASTKCGKTAQGTLEALMHRIPCASSFAIKTGTPERRAPAEGQGTPCPCPSACILHPVAGFHISPELVIRSRPFFRSAAGFPVGIPDRLAQKKTATEAAKLGGHLALLQAYSIMKREHGISGWYVKLG